MDRKRDSYTSKSSEGKVSTENIYPALNDIVRNASNPNSPTDSLQTHHRSNEYVDDDNQEVSLKHRKSRGSGENSRENLNKSGEGINKADQNLITNKEANKPNEVNFRNKKNRDKINKSKSHDGNFRYYGNYGSHHGSKRSIETRVRIDEGRGVTTEPLEHVPEIYPPPQDGFAVVDFEYAEYDPDAQNKCTKFVERIQQKTHGFFSLHGKRIKLGIVIIFVILYFIYFCFAIHTSVDGAVVLIALTSLTVSYLTLREVWRRCGDRIYAVTCGPVATVFDKPWWKYCRW